MITDKSLIVMKFGVHASEQPYDTISRKERELKENSTMYWGYGGTLLDPIKVVQPFCEECGGNIWVYMIPTKSPHLGEPLRSTKMSTNKYHWTDIPGKVNVLGSKKAIVCDKIEMINETINIGNYSVAIGPSKGRNVSDYLQNRTDKACMVESNSNKKEKLLKAIYRFGIASPYAVYVV